MPVEIIRLIGSPNQRSRLYSSFLSQDQRFVGAVPCVIDNPLTGKRTLYCEKRAGFNLRNAGPSASSCVALKIMPVNAYTVYCLNVGGTYTVYAGNAVALDANCGTLPAAPQGGITTGLINGEECIFIGTGTQSSTNQAFYMTVNAFNVTPFSFTADTANGSPALANIVNGIWGTTGVLAGQLITGTGIPANTRIKSVDSSTTATMTNNATATNVGVTVTRTALAKFISANFPSDCVGALAELDGFVFTNTYSGKIYNGDLNSLANWSAINNLAMTSPSGVSLVNHRGKIIALGRRSIEAFSNVGTPTGSPLSRLTVPSTYYGCLTADAVAQGADHTFFITDGEGESRSVMDLAPDGSLKRISTAVIDNLIKYVGTGTGQISMQVFTFYGKTVLLVQSAYPSTYLFSYLYFINEGIWMESGFPFIFMLGGMTGAVIKAMAFDSTSGKVYGISDNPIVYQDDGVAYTMTIQTSRVNHGTDRRKFVGSIKLIGDEQASGTATLEVSDDDYANWVTLGTFDMTAHEKKIQPGGSYKGGRSYRLTHSANTAFRAEALEIDYTVGTN